MHVIVDSQKDKGKALRKPILKDIVPRGFDTKTENLTSRVQALEFTNEEECQVHQHQQSIKGKEQETDDLVKNRHVLRRRYFDNVLCFIKNNKEEVHPYYVIRYQYRQLEKYKRYLKLCYPNMEEAGRCDDPNAIHQWNIFKSEAIEKSNNYKNYFSLTEEKRELLDAVLDVTI